MAEVSELRARYHFRVRQLLVKPDLLGTSHEFSEGAARVVVTFPIAETEGDEGAPLPQFPAEEPPPAEIGGFITSSGPSFAPSDVLARVDALRVDVFVSAAGISAARFRDDEVTDWTGRQGNATDVLWRNRDVAESAVERLLEWIRTEGNQHWLGLAGAAPEAVGHAELVDVAGWTRIPVTVSIEPVVLKQVSEEQVLSAGRLAVLLSIASKGARPSLADSILVDAAFYASDAEPPDPMRAVLTAAIAVELKVKQTLLEAAEGPLRELVAVLFESPRDYSLAAVALFDKPLRIVLGVSLRESDKALYKRIETLFKRRNDVAHRGKAID